MYRWLSLSPITTRTRMGNIREWSGTGIMICLNCQTSSERWYCCTCRSETRRPMCCTKIGSWRCMVNTRSRSLRAVWSFNRIWTWPSWWSTVSRCACRRRTVILSRKKQRIRKEQGRVGWFRAVDEGRQWRRYQIGGNWKYVFDGEKEG